MSEPVQPIRTAQSIADPPEEAVTELASQLSCPPQSLILFFCSSRYDLDAIANAMASTFAQQTVVGCTSSGEIGPQGYTNGGISAACFPPGHLSVVTGLIQPLDAFQISQGDAFVQGLMRALENQDSRAREDNTFALLLIDGLSQQEEPIARSLSKTLGAIPIVGGSAGDDLRFERTHIFHQGRFHTNTALILLASTTAAIHAFKTQHFKATDQRLVVTQAEPGSRRVLEINGLPAAEEYARLVGVDLNDLNPMRFAASPVVVLIDGQEYVRSIQKANPDGSLTFYCAIDEGIVLRVAEGVDLTQNMQQALERVTRQIGPPELILGCDCVLRKLEINQKGLSQEIGHLLAQSRVLGFNTYGEQFGGVHVNQTFTGLALGSPRGDR
ncbi:MAG: nitric oxide-sensing protein NosP [Saccharospirillum sp.]